MTKRIVLFAPILFTSVLLTAQQAPSSKVPVTSKTNVALSNADLGDFPYFRTLPNFTPINISDSATDENNLAYFYDGKNYFTGILHEITEKKQDEIRKNDFIGMVSHELKTPLTSIKGYIQILSLKLKSHEDDLILGALDKVNTQVAKMTGMINGFLNVSRLDSGKIHVDLQHFDLAELIRDSEEETKTTITSHTLLFEPVSSALVYADREKIGQVIHNLISNAVKYSPLGSTIQVSCILHQGAAAVSVKDFGMGIKADDQDKIFDRYYRVEGSQMSSISGFGVGLYLCSEIIKRHQGQISVESNFGEGSTFTFKLPLLAG